jgi:hypothetical protein
MTSDLDLVELTSVPTPFEAHLLVGALSVRDVEAVTFGEMLADEFAMSQELFGSSGGVRVMVARGDLDRAREALAAIEREREATSAQVEEEHDAPDEG